MAVLAGIGGVLLLLLIWSAHDLARHADDRAGIAVLVGVAVPAVLVLAVMGGVAGSAGALALALLAAVAIPFALSGRRPRRRPRLVTAPAPVVSTLPAAHSERRAA
jgi:hypothetical protein